MDDESKTADEPLYSINPSRSQLLACATRDARAGVEAMEQGNWLSADILLKLAIDQLADTGLIP